MTIHSVRNLDAEVVARIKELARIHRRSVEAEMREMLTQAAGFGLLKEHQIREAQRLHEVKEGNAVDFISDLMRKVKATDKKPA